MFYMRVGILLFLGCLSLFPYLNAQSLVSTSPTLRTAVLEEFGGIYCVYCPHGHQIIEDMMESPIGDQLVAINYHSGTFADPLPGDPDFRNDYGDALIAASMLSGYPAATVNRRTFPGLASTAGATALNRSHWEEAVATLTEEIAVVNLGASATTNISTGLIELQLEYYYTANSGGDDNFLHIGIVQNNVLGPQIGGNLGDYYPHQRLFRDYITGAQGQVINTPSGGTFGALTFDIQLPEHYREVIVDPVNIELIAFITDEAGEILNGINISPSLEAVHASDVHLLSIIGDNDICGSALNAQVQFRNNGTQPLTACEFVFGTSSGSFEQHSWEGTLAPLAITTIDLPTVYPNLDSTTNDLVVTALEPNGSTDPTSSNNVLSHAFALAPSTDDFVLELAIRTDNFGYEFYWEVVDPFGFVVASGGNPLVEASGGGAQIAGANDPGAYPNNEIIVEEIFLWEAGCYELRVYDDYADGICCFYGPGFYLLREPNGEVLVEGGEFGALATHAFAASGGGATNLAGVADVPDNQLQVFPNPISGQQTLQLQWTDQRPDRFVWRIVSSDGRPILQGDQQQLPQTTHLPSGFYLIQIQDAQQTWSHSFIKV